MTDEHLDEALAAYLGRKPRRAAGWGKAVLVGAISAATSIVGTTWAARGKLDDIEHRIDLQGQDLHYMREHVDSVEREAIAAKQSGDEAKAMMFAMKGGYPGKAP